MQKLTQIGRKKFLKIFTFTFLALLSALILLSPETMAFASGAEGGGAAGGTITSGFTNLLDIVKSLVSSMQSQDGVMQSSAFKRIGGGLVMVLAPQLISVFTG